MEEGIGLGDRVRHGLRAAQLEFLQRLVGAGEHVGVCLVELLDPAGGRLAGGLDLRLGQLRHGVEVPRHGVGVRGQLFQRGLAHFRHRLRQRLLGRADERLDHVLGGVGGRLCHVLAQIGHGLERRLDQGAAVVVGLAQLVGGGQQPGFRLGDVPGVLDDADLVLAGAVEPLAKLVVQLLQMQGVGGLLRCRQAPDLIADRVEGLGQDAHLRGHVDAQRFHRVGGGLLTPPDQIFLETLEPLVDRRVRGAGGGLVGGLAERAPGVLIKHRALLRTGVVRARATYHPCLLILVCSVL